MADGEKESMISHHKEESVISFDTDEHPQTGIVNIYTGQVVDNPGWNVHKAVVIGTEQWQEFESHWPEGFHDKLKQKVKTVVAAIKLKLSLVMIFT